MSIPSSFEQYALEIINASRLDPVSAAATYGVALNAGLPAGTISVDQKQPLAFNLLLNDAAEDHSEWMLATDVFSHTGAGGSNARQRMEAAGYQFSGSWTWGENIGWAGSTGTLNAKATLEWILEGLYESPGHRANTFNPDFSEIGLGYSTGQYTDGATYNAGMLTENFAKSGGNSFITGVVYNDTDNDSAFSFNEGVGGTVIDVRPQGGNQTSYNNWATGGYSAAATATGAVEVTFTQASTSVTVTIEIQTQNTKVDLRDGTTLTSSASATLGLGAIGLQLLGINDTFGVGNGLANEVTGNRGSNLLAGGSGSDVLSGAEGNDVLEGDDGAALDVFDAQVFRLYQTMLARQPDEGGKEFWAAQLFDQTLDVVSMAAGFESSTEFQTTYGGLNDSDFINLLYNNVLNRDADKVGEAFWLNELSNGATRAEVAAGFSESNEFVDLTEATNAYYLSSGMPLGLTDDVFRLYQATLDRNPDMPGLMGWLEFLSTGQPKVVVAEGFVSSAEFQTTYGGLNDSDFINLLYNNVLDRDADTVGEAYWLNEIANGATRAEVVLGFSDSPEFISNTAEAVNTWMRTTPGTANDVLFGGADDDRMFGGFGTDSFVFDNTMDGADFVGDLERWDTLVFNNFGYTDKADVLAKMSQVEMDVVFSDQGNTVTLAHTTLADLSHADMFSFDDTTVLV